MHFNHLEDHYIRLLGPPSAFWIEKVWDGVLRICMYSEFPEDADTAGF